MFDAKKVMEEAQAEVQKEQSEKAKKALVSKLKEIDAAKLVLRNLEREKEDLLVRIGEGNL